MIYALLFAIDIAIIAVSAYIYCDASRMLKRARQR